MTRYARHSVIEQKRITYSGWLVVDELGAMRLSRAEPGLASGERAISVSLQVPRSLFRTPTLRATVVVPDGAAPALIEAETVAELERAVKAATGLELVLTHSAGPAEPGEA